LAVVVQHQEAPKCLLGGLKRSRAMCYRDDEPMTSSDWKQATKDIILMCLMVAALILVAAINDPSVGK